MGRQGQSEPFLPKSLTAETGSWTPWQQYQPSGPLGSSQECHLPFGMERPSGSLKEGRPRTRREGQPACGVSCASTHQGNVGGRSGTEGPCRGRCRRWRQRYSQDVHDDAQGPHVTRLVILLWTQDLRSYQGRRHRRALSPKGLRAQVAA